MPLVGLVLHVRGGNGDAARLLFRSVIDRVKRAELNLRVVLLQYLGDGRRQRGLAVVDMTNRPYVHMRLIALKFLFRHFLAPCGAGPSPASFTFPSCPPEPGR